MKFYDGMYGSDVEVHMTSSHQLKVKRNYTIGTNKPNELFHYLRQLKR